MFNSINVAVLAALDQHPLYKTQLSKSETGELFWNENSEVPVIQKFQPTKRIIYGDKKYNYFPWIIRYTNNKLIVSVAHMLSDGTGVVSFIKTVLKLYLKKENLQLSSDCLVPIKTTEDAYLKFGKKVSVPKHPLKKVQSSNVSSSLLVKDKEHLITYRLILEKQTIKDMALKYGVKPVAITSYLFAKALEKTLNLSEGTIYIPIPVNARTYYETNTDRNFIFNAPLEYDIKKNRNLTLKKVAQSFYKQFQSGISQTKVLPVFNDFVQLTKTIKKNSQIIKSMRKDANTFNDNKTATICYSHITYLNYPKELVNFIKRMEFTAVPPRDCSCVFIFGLNFKKKITFSIQHIFKNNAFIKNLSDVLTQENISYSLTKSKYKNTTIFESVK